MRIGWDLFKEQSYEALKEAVKKKPKNKKPQKILIWRCEEEKKKMSERYRESL